MLARKAFKQIFFLTFFFNALRNALQKSFFPLYIFFKKRYIFDQIYNYFNQIYNYFNQKYNYFNKIYNYFNQIHNYFNVDLYLYLLCIKENVKTTKNRENKIRHKVCVKKFPFIHCC